MGDTVYFNSDLDSPRFTVETVTTDGQGNTVINGYWTRAPYADYHDGDITVELGSNVEGFVAVMNGNNTTTITAKNGDTITYSVSKQYWVTDSGTFVVEDEDQDYSFYKYVTLEPTADATLNINVTIENAEDLTNLNVTFTSSDADMVSSGTAATVHANNTVQYVITADGMETFTSGTVTLSSYSMYPTIMMRPANTLYAYYDSNGSDTKYLDSQLEASNANVLDSTGTIVGTIREVSNDQGFTNGFSVDVVGQDTPTWYYRRSEYDILPQAPTEAPTEEPTQNPSGPDPDDG